VRYKSGRSAIPTRFLLGNMLTIKFINKVIAPYRITLVKGVGYFYWLDETQNPIPDSMTCVYNLNHFTLQQWVDEAEYVLEEAIKSGWITRNDPIPTIRIAGSCSA